MSILETNDLYPPSRSLPGMEVLVGLVLKNESLNDVCGSRNRITCVVEIWIIVLLPLSITECRSLEFLLDLPLFGDSLLGLDYYSTDLSFGY